jgi:hypothetical protein
MITDIKHNNLMALFIRVRSQNLLLMASVTSGKQEALKPTPAV